MGDGAFGIEVPNGDPGALEGAAADLRGVSGAMQSASAALGSSATVAGWSGTASLQYANQCVSQRDVAHSAGTVMDAVARTLSELAVELRTATRKAERAVDAAREADRRRRAAEDEAASAHSTQQSASDRGQVALQHAITAEASGAPAASLHAQADQAFGEAAVAADRAADAEARARRAQEEFEEAVREGKRAVREYERYGDQAAQVIGGLSGAAPAVVVPPPPAAPAGVDSEGGNVLDGIWKGLGDVKDEAVGLGTGAFHHVNVFNPDKLGDTWSNDWEIAQAIGDDPLGAAESVWNSTTAPIVESYRTGGLDEAIARTVPSVAGTVLGGKGLTKLGKLEAPETPDTPGIQPGDDVFRLYGQREDKLGLEVQEGATLPDGRSMPVGSRAMGQSWTTKPIEDMANPRAELGLPDANPARFLIHARVVDPSGMELRAALPLDGHPGGGPEVLIPDPERQLRIIRVEGVNPEP